MGTIKTTNIEPIADNGTVTLGSSGDTFTLGSGVTQTIAVNTPAFFATNLGTNQTGVSDNTYTKVTIAEVTIFNNSTSCSGLATLPVPASSEPFL